VFSTGPAIRHLPDVAPRDAAETLRRFGFHDHEPDPDRIVMKKPGLRFAFRAHQRPMEATLAPRGEGTELAVRYDVFVAFDSGELEAHADRLVHALA
jgi:hypothetical protein